jgi:hypothetical protein
MSIYQLTDTNYLLPESGYLPRHNRTGVVSETCMDGVAKSSRLQVETVRRFRNKSPATGRGNRLHALPAGVLGQKGAFKR